MSNDEFSAILQSGTPSRGRWLAMLDKVAQGLQQLNEKGVTVFYRPLHEMNGEWFWWGATGENTNDTVRMDLYRRLYQDIFNYFVKTKGLNNLLWVFSPDANRVIRHLITLAQSMLILLAWTCIQINLPL